MFPHICSLDLLSVLLYVALQYVDKSLIQRETSLSDVSLINVHMWEAVKTKNIQMAYRLLVASDASSNTKFDEVNSELYHTVDRQRDENSVSIELKQSDPTLCPKLHDSGEPESCLQGCSLLHLACHGGDLVMLELLLQFGADINVQDFHGRTPLHHCICAKNDSLAKYLLRRYYYGLVLIILYLFYVDMKSWPSFSPS